jgi:hypothetical protein
VVEARRLMERLALIQLALLTLPPLEAHRRIAALCAGSWSSAIHELADELATLRREVGEWVCPCCSPIVLPGNPPPGMPSAPCPRCGTPTIPRGERERRDLRSRMALLDQRAEAAEAARGQEAARTQRALEAFLGPGWRLIRGGDVDATISWALDRR